METASSATQSPLPGESRVWYCGDLVTFTLTISHPVPGRAFVRTNLGAAAIARKEIINRVERDEIKLDEAWYDIEMPRVNNLEFTIVLPLHEVGFFKAKCFFISNESQVPLWPTGENVVLNVEPAGTCCANIIYNAFVRQFGRPKSEPMAEQDILSAVRTLDSQGYTVIPESGKFRDLKTKVEFIFSRLGCRVLHLLPIHPTPTTYARMGRFGSPYAALNFTEVDPALARFDPSATPLEQFMELADTVHLYDGYLFMDIAINHTGWAASIHETNPEWLVRGENGKIEAPGAWGIVWADLTKLDYTNRDLWKYMADVFLLWCGRGVDGFRCDAGYMIPVAAWEYIVAKVRQVYPETLFFLEGLGGPVKTTREILSRANFNWAYSELFQNYTREEITHYLPGACEISETCGHTIHFAETHDNNRLASVSTRYAKMRTSLSALFSVNGGFGFANGVEWFATQKIDVHESGNLNWGNPENQVDHIARLNRMLKNHPAFFARTRISLIQSGRSECLVLLRNNEKHLKKVLILVNLDCTNSSEVAWKQGDAGIEEKNFYDLITGSVIKINTPENTCTMRLSPGEVLALTPDPADLEIFSEKSESLGGMPHKVYVQKLMANVLSIHTALKGYGDISGMDVKKQSRRFAENPVEFIRSLNPLSRESRVIVLDVGKDKNRQIMVPPGFFLMVKCRRCFRAKILDESRSSETSLGYEEGLPFWGGGERFALFLPGTAPCHHKPCTLHLRLFDNSGTRCEKIPLLYLAPFERVSMQMSFIRKEIVKNPDLKLLATTGRGGMMRTSAFWGRLDSRYDAILGANINKSLPEDRWMVLSRFRIWAVFQGYSRQLTLDCLEKFTVSYDHGGKWRFHVPTSEGKYYALELCAAIEQGKNRIRLSILRKRASKGTLRFLRDDQEITLIIRPDIEDRSFHETVKAFAGPEKQWPHAVTASGPGFRFSLSRNHTLQVGISRGVFVREDEWQYMVHRPLEAERGLEAESDLFSPGYFSVSCAGGKRVVLDADVIENPLGKIRFDPPGIALEPTPFEASMPLAAAVYKSLDAFMVNREGDKSVIAGYPWFLDWGRDSLIFCRGLIELGRYSDARAILRLFGRFEDHGTLPNMICGNDAGNIETSDAPLWFFTCCRELVQKEKSPEFLDEKWGDRTFRDILFSIADSLLKGTKTGVKADPESFLLYSPSHFTWMDTNYPAGSPRQGYPIEIQALWYNALGFMASIDIDRKKDWQDKARMVQTAISKLFYSETSGFFSDCLHAKGPVGAKNAVPDDALRPNQLFLFVFDVIRDQDISVRCLETCQELLVPGAIRSLADRRVEYGVPVYYNNELINNPHFPYSGEYSGDEDRKRKPAYHNGTAWTWQFPIFCEAWATVFGRKSHATCLSWLSSASLLMRKGVAGYIPEILDGDFPHTSRGCDAQAWGSSEFARVIHKLSQSCAASTTH